MREGDYPKNPESVAEEEKKGLGEVTKEVPK